MEKKIYFKNQRGVVVTESDLKRKNIPEITQVARFYYQGIPRFVFEIEGAPQFNTIRIYFFHTLRGGGCIDYLENVERFTKNLPLKPFSGKKERDETLSVIMHDFAHVAPDEERLRQFISTVAGSIDDQHFRESMENIFKYLYMLERSAATAYIDKLIDRHRYIVIHKN
jgi:hypothetical protein